MYCSRKKQPVGNLTSFQPAVFCCYSTSICFFANLFFAGCFLLLQSFIMKITAIENDIKDMQLSYKHWVSSKNHRALDFKRTSAANEDFDPEEYYISSLFVTCDSWCFSFRWVRIRLLPCRFRDCHSDLCQIFFVWNKTFFNRFSAGYCSRSLAHGVVSGFGYRRVEWPFHHHYCQIHSDLEWYSTWQGSKFGLNNLSIFLRGADF